MALRDCILVTGAAGYIGSHIALYAHEHGCRVIAVDDLSAGQYWPALPSTIQQVTCDIGWDELMSNLMEHNGVTAVIHCAGKISVAESMCDPALYFGENTVKTISLLGLCAERAAAFILASSAAVYQASKVALVEDETPLKPCSPYGASKLAAELALDSYSRDRFPAVALRYFNVAGARSGLRERHDPEEHLIPSAIDAALGRRPPLTIYGDDYATSDGTALRDYVHVWDVARAHLAAIDALENGKELGAVNIGRSRGFSVMEVIESVQLSLGKRVPYEVGPRRAGDSLSLVADITRARELMKWQPEHDLITMIGDAAASRASS